MISAHHWFANVSSWLWPALLHHLWQATIFAAVVWLFCLLAKPASGKTRYGIWLLASCKFAIPAVLVAHIAAPFGVQAPWLKNEISSTSSRAVIEFPLLEPLEETLVMKSGRATPPGAGPTHEELYCILTLGWGFGALFFLGLWWQRHWVLKSKLRNGQTLLSGEALEALHRAKVLLQTRQPIRLLLSSDFPEPGVCGIRKSTLVLPRGVAETLTNEELEAIFLHEVAHVRRRDNLAGMFQSWLCCAFWFHPVIWLIERQLLLERERACDEEVLSHNPDCQDYFSGLLKVFRSSLGEKLVGASLITGSNLKRRIDHMRSHGSRKNGMFWHRLSISGFFLAMLVSVIGAALLNQRSLAQQHSESPMVVGSKQNEEAPTANMGIGPGVPGGVARGIEGGVGAGVRGGVTRGIEGRVGAGVSGRVPTKPSVRGANHAPDPPLSVAMNQLLAPTAQQAGSAKLFGTVSDASQARVPNATIVVSNKEGGIKEITSSSAAGEFEFRILPLGRYSVEVRTGGFRPFQQALELHANEPRELHVVLEVGEVAETVNVVAKAPPAAPPDTRSGPPRRIRVGGNVQATKLVHRVQPIYPEQAQVQGIQGTVLIEAVILKDGSMGTMRVLNKLADPDLVASAVEAVKNWRYEPTLLNGQPIEVVTTITVNFRLSSS